MGVVRVKMRVLEPKGASSWSQFHKIFHIVYYHLILLRLESLIRISRDRLKNHLSKHKRINENKEIQRRPGSRKKSTISKSIFKIIKEYIEIDNDLITYELSNKLFEIGVKMAVKLFIDIKFLKALTIHLNDSL